MNNFQFQPNYRDNRGHTAGTLWTARPNNDIKTKKNKQKKVKTPKNKKKAAGEKAESEPKGDDDESSVAENTEVVVEEILTVEPATAD